MVQLWHEALCYWTTDAKPVIQIEKPQRSKGIWRTWCQQKIFEASMMIRQGRVLGSVYKKKKTKEEENQTDELMWAVWTNEGRKAWCGESRHPPGHIFIALFINVSTFLLDTLKIGKWLADVMNLHVPLHLFCLLILLYVYYLSSLQNFHFMSLFFPRNPALTQWHIAASLQITGDKLLIIPTRHWLCSIVTGVKKIRLTTVTTHFA